MMISGSRKMRSFQFLGYFASRHVLLLAAG